MKKIESTTLEEAYTKASQELGCSITDLEIEVIQHPSKGFLGIGKKKAIIVASCKRAAKVPVARAPKEEILPKPERKEPRREVEAPRAEEKKISAKEPQEEPKKLEPERKPPLELFEEKEVFGDFYKYSMSIEEICHEIEIDINALFKNACFDIDPVTVSPYDDTTVFVKFSGKDAALLIGKEGYRYKALSYMLYNWINTKYNLGVRLEIAEFLKTQEEQIRKYLSGVIENIKKEGRGQTKILDGVLIQIALRDLREAFPDKYVGVRTTKSDEKYIIVNNFNK